MALNLKAFKVKLRRFSDVILWIVTAISAVMLTTSVLFYVMNCYMRYVMRAPLAWPEEYCIYIVVLMFYFIQCRLEFRNEGLGIGIIDAFLAKSKLLRIFATLFHGTVAIFVYVVLLNVGRTVVRQQIRFGVLSPVMRVPMSIYFSLINVCFILVILFWVIRLFTQDYDKMGEVDIE